MTIREDLDWWYKRIKELEEQYGFGHQMFLDHPDMWNYTQGIKAVLFSIEAILYVSQP